jgi:hypothetical protein
MGAGKSSIGKKLARRLGSPFVDSDRVIVQRHGPIAGIFERDGEGVFRSSRSAPTAWCRSAGEPSSTSRPAPPWRVCPS